ncbi:efflux RND transporter periplasmic adaptor subunit [Catenuloplanes atrovinosus]|uniref:HlyD family secretion protein n=1 Tax=Catenuloplanes atrovinosus TaxID=137266 RepID=A0AAE4CE74_9ACTN|nr:HlyD family efflux transporter periplasmic adaptor subunit [Catenuloplanes atrovinosus]MDR7279779.1 HlyD family secretion protein [Catenuloplanes atrovinosus]
MRIAVGVAVAAVVVAGATTAYALTSGPGATADEPTLVAADTGDVTLAVAATGTLAPARTRSLSFGTSAEVTAVNVRPGDVVRAGDVLAEVDATDAQETVDKAAEDLATAQEDLSTASSTADTDTGTETGCATAAGYATGGTTPTPAPSTGGGPVPAVTVTVTETVTVYVTVPASPSASTSPSPSTTATPAPSTTPSRPSTGPSTGGSGPSTNGGSTNGGTTNGGTTNGGTTNGGTDGGTGGGSTCGGGTDGGPTGGSTGRAGGDAVYNAQKKVTSARLALDEAEEALAGAVIKAPVGGRILSVAGGIGSSAGAGSTFITLGDVGGMEVRAEFPEADAGRLVVGQTASVTLADRPGETFPATVTQVDPVGTATDGMVTYGTLITFDTVPEDVLAGQHAQATVTVSAVSGVLRVPASVVHDVADGAGTVTVRVDGVDERRAVRVGLIGDAYAEIVSGLTTGETVVAS